MAAEITDRHPSTRTMMNHFDFEHLPAGPLRDTSHRCHDLAWAMFTDSALDEAELTAGLRKLLEAKDCFVRAALANPLEK